MLQEPGWERIATELTSRTHGAIGAPTLTETAIVLRATGAPPSLQVPVDRRRQPDRIE